MTGFLFGKLPAFGDFVSRGLSAPMRDWWDGWCTTALLDACWRFEGTFEQRYSPTEPRRFLIEPLGGASWQAGCVIASRDRAGRAFPFVLGITCLSPIEPITGGAMAERIASCLGSVFEPRIDLDALAATARDAANDPLTASRPAAPIDLCERWIGKYPYSVKV